MSKGWIIHPCEKMRKSPDCFSEVVSEAFFSEEIFVWERKKEWSLIETGDAYRGWVQTVSFVFRDEPYEADLRVERCSAHLYREKEIEKGALLTLPFEARLKKIEAVDTRWLQVETPDRKKGFIQRGDVTVFECVKEKRNLQKWSERFLGLPYTWGGRSSFGYDCSGFVQMLYRQIGVFLPRDAKQQVQDPRLSEIPLTELEAGDLIFWGKHAEKITHVGMYLENGRFIHASSREGKPWLRISHLFDSEWSGTKDSSTPYRVAKSLAASGRERKKDCI